MKIYSLQKKVLKKGLTLVEVLVAMAILTLIGFSITAFERDIFSFNSFIQSDLNAQIAGRKAITRMVSEMREMSPSSLGSYPIAAAATSTITFYSDIDTDSAKEQIRYYVSGTNIMKSVINPTGSPLVYNSGSAVVTTVASSVANGTSTPIFEYYDTNYSGTTTPLSTPVNIASIKLVKINILIEAKSSRGIIPLNLTSQVTLRNLKDNL